MTDDVRKQARLWFWGILGALCIVLALWLIPREQAARYRQRFPETETSKLDHKDRVQLEKDLIAAENAVRTTLAQIIGGLVVLIGLWLTHQNVKAAQLNAKTAQENARIAQDSLLLNTKTTERNLQLIEEGKLTERFSKAIELLGNATLDVRLGGIYALERIAKDSAKDHWTVVEVLTAFIREKTRPVFSPEKNGPLLDEIKYPPGDVQAALTVISRRTKRDEEGAIDLSYTRLTLADLRNAPLKRANLVGINLNQANCSFANLRGANLEHADLDFCNFGGANLEGANLEGASLRGAGLCGVDLNNAYLHQADLHGAVLHQADLNGADLSKASLEWADLYGVDLVEANLSEASFMGVKLIAVDLSGANLSGANLIGVDLGKTNLSEADLSGANLVGANLLNCVGLAADKMQGVIMDENTKLPRDVERARINRAMLNRDVDANL